MFHKLIVTIVFLGCFIPNISYSLSTPKHNTHLAPIHNKHEYFDLINVFLSEDIKTQYIEIERLIKLFKGEVITVTLTSNNGNNVELSIPHPNLLNKLSTELKNKIYKTYIAKFYARGLALGNPGDILYTKITDKNDKRMPEEELTLNKIIYDYFNSVGSSLLNKANAGNIIEIKSIGTKFIPKTEAGLTLTKSIRYLTLEEMKRLDTPIISIGFDVGGQGIDMCVTINGKNMTETLFPMDEDGNKEEDKSFRYRYSFKFSDLKKGGHGIDFSNRLTQFVKEVVMAIEKKDAGYKVNSVFVSIPGAPDYNQNRMSTIGQLSRGFSFVNEHMEMDNANKFINTLEQFMSERRGVFGFGNDMVGWGLAIAKEADIINGIAIITGSGIGVKRIQNGRDVYGVNEGGHQTLKPYDYITNGTDDVQGSFEIFGGSIPGILKVSKIEGLTDMLIRKGLNESDIEVKHIGLVASGINPIDEKVKLPDDSNLKKLALKVWEKVEEIEAQHVLFNYFLTGEKQFAFTGGTTAFKTGEIRLNFLNKALLKYWNELELEGDLPKIKLVRANAAAGAAEKATQIYQEKIVHDALKSGIIRDYNSGDSIFDMVITLSIQSNEERESIITAS